MIRVKLEHELAQKLLPVDRRKQKRRQRIDSPAPNPPVSSGPAWTDTDRRIFLWEAKVRGLRTVHQIRQGNRKTINAYLLFACLRDLADGPKAKLWRAYYRSRWRRGLKT